MMEHIYLLILSLTGFLVSAYIYYKKNRKEKLVCIIGKDCNKVIHSKYSKFFGLIDNEIIGMLYYSLVLIFSLLGFFSLQFLLLPSFVLGKLVISGTAALASLALLYIQVFIFY